VSRWQGYLKPSCAELKPKLESKQSLGRFRIELEQTTHDYFNNNLARVVAAKEQGILYNAIHRINHYPEDSVISMLFVLLSPGTRLQIICGLVRFKIKHWYSFWLVETRGTLLTFLDVICPWLANIWICSCFFSIRVLKKEKQQEK